MKTKIVCNGCGKEVVEESDESLNGREGVYSCENGCFQRKGLDSELMSEEDTEETTLGKFTDENGAEHVSYLMHSCADDTRIDFDEDKNDYFCTGCEKRFSKDIMKRRVYNAMNTANSDIRDVAMYANAITEIEQA